MYHTTRVPLPFFFGSSGAPGSQVPPRRCGHNISSDRRPCPVVYNPAGGTTHMNYLHAEPNAHDLGVRVSSLV